MAGTGLSVPLIDRPLLKAASALGAKSGDVNASGVPTQPPVAEIPGCEEFVAYIVGSAGVASGAVQLEEAHDPAYTGTWSAIGAPVTVVASTVIAIHQLGTNKAVRARVSTVLAGGTVDVIITAR